MDDVEKAIGEYRAALGPMDKMAVIHFMEAITAEVKRLREQAEPARLSETGDAAEIVGKLTDPRIVAKARWRERAEAEAAAFERIMDTGGRPMQPAPAEAGPDVPEGFDACSWDEALKSGHRALGLFGPRRTEFGLWEGADGNKDAGPYTWLRPRAAPASDAPIRWVPGECVWQSAKGAWYATYQVGGFVDITPSFGSSDGAMEWAGRDDRTPVRPVLAPEPIDVERLADELWNNLPRDPSYNQWRGIVRRALAQMGLVGK